MPPFMVSRVLCCTKVEVRSWVKFPTTKHHIILCLFIYLFWKGGGGGGVIPPQRENICFPCQSESILLHKHKTSTPTHLDLLSLSWEQLEGGGYASQPWWEEGPSLWESRGQSGQNLSIFYSTAKNNHGTLKILYRGLSVAEQRGLDTVPLAKTLGALHKVLLLQNSAWVGEILARTTANLHINKVYTSKYSYTYNRTGEYHYYSTLAHYIIRRW